MAKHAGTYILSKDVERIAPGRRAIVRPTPVAPLPLVADDLRVAAREDAYLATLEGK